MNTVKKYILVDDDPFNNIISNMEIEGALGKVDIKIFEIPEDGLTFIQAEYSVSLLPTILFLDINMPSLSGWDFLERYETFREDIKSQISIYILSSSIDPRDIDKAKANKCIRGYIPKPLESAVILSIASQDFQSDSQSVFRI